MALYKLDETGEAIRVDLGDYMRWRNGLDESCLILARHDIIEHKQLGALALDALKGKPHKGRVLATVETRACPNTQSDETPPWSTYILGEEEDEWMCSTWKRGDARSAHIGIVNMVTKNKGGRVLIR